MTSSTILSIIESYPNGCRFRQISKVIDEHPHNIMDEIQRLANAGSIRIDYGNEVRYIPKKEEGE